MPRELEPPEEPLQRSYPAYNNLPCSNQKGSISHSTSSEMPNSWKGEVNGQSSSTDPSNSVTDDCFGFKLVPGVWADCFASFIPYDQEANFEQGEGVFQC